MMLILELSSAWQNLIRQKKPNFDLPKEAKFWLADRSQILIGRKKPKFISQTDKNEN